MKVTINRVNENKTIIENQKFRVEVKNTAIGAEYTVYPKIIPRGANTSFAPKLGCGLESREYDGITVDDLIELLDTKLSKEEIDDDYNSNVVHYKWNGHTIYTALNIGQGKYIITCSANNIGIAYIIDAFLTVDDEIVCTVENQYTAYMSPLAASYEIGEVR